MVWDEIHGIRRWVLLGRGDGIFQPKGDPLLGHG